MTPPYYDEDGMSEPPKPTIWDYASFAYCSAQEGQTRLRPPRLCRWYADGKDTGPRPGHEGCEAVLTATKVGQYLEVDKYGPEDG